MECTPLLSVGRKNGCADGGVEGLGVGGVEGGGAFLFAEKQVM